MIWIVAKREIVTRARSKGFLVITALLFVLVIGMAVASAVVSGDDDAREVTIGLIGKGVDFGAALDLGNEQIAPKIETVQNAVKSVEDEAVDVVFDGERLTWKGIPDVDLDAYVREVVEQERLAERAEGLGLSPSDLQGLFRPVEIGEVRLDGGDETLGVRIATAAATGFATFLLLMIWGGFITTGVVEEKSSKVVEVLLSRVRPSTLLAGKVLGLGVLAVGQMLVVVAGVVLGLSLQTDIAIPGSVWASVPLFVITFLLGFGFYSTAFAAVGAMVSRQEDAQSTQIIVMAPLFVGYVIAASAISDPDNAVVTVASLVPFTSPVLLPFRTAMTEVPTWQVIAALAILAVSILVMLRVAGRIYRYSLLRTGRRVTWGEAWRNRGVDSF